MDVLLFQIVDDCQYVFDLLQSWDPTEIEDLLRALVEKLRSVINVHIKFRVLTCPH